jgi:hypothetical protein
MDAFLTEDCRRLLEAWGRFSRRPTEKGFLLGHKRGRRFIVEQVVPAGSGFSAFIARFHDVNAFFGGKIIGFFSFGTGPQTRKLVLSPIGYGKLFLEAGRGFKKGLILNSSVIEFGETFHFKRIPLRPGPKGGTA